MEGYIYTYCNMRMYISYSVMNVTMNVVLMKYDGNNHGDKDSNMSTSDNNSDTNWIVAANILDVIESILLRKINDGDVGCWEAILDSEDEDMTDGILVGLVVGDIKVYLPLLNNIYFYD